ncbi:unnamed protein product [Sphenostylis stenocarpa]|uniref:Uncharacterized protein n=1 Tax=Sphenostylis stenocarpa TaxID=92480 RepID=A0AA86W3X3_9FABA|nr:unnamed protein product [Sphenostylis stenocarpa]
MQEIGQRRKDENPKPQILVGIREERTESAAREREREKKGTRNDGVLLKSKLWIFGELRCD